MGEGGMVEKRGREQGTCMNDPWACTMPWGWTVGMGVGWDEGVKRWEGEWD